MDTPFEALRFEEEERLNFEKSDLNRAIGFPSTSTALIELMHLSIAEAVLAPNTDQSRLIALMRSRLGTDDLATALRASVARAEAADRWAADWSAATLALAAVDHPWLEVEELLGGALHRRIDAVYDLFETAFCAHEAQGQYLAVLEDLAEAVESASITAVKVGATFGLGAISGAGASYGFLAPPTLVAKAAAWIDDQGRELDDLIRFLGKVLLVWMLVPGTDDGEHTQIETRIIQGVQSLGRDADPNDARTARLFRAVLNVMGASFHQGAPMPDLCRQLDEAKRLASSHGLEVITVDSTGQDRSPWIESNWVVTGQHPPPGAPIDSLVVVLGIRKTADSSGYAGSPSPVHLDDVLAAKHTLELHRRS